MCYLLPVIFGSSGVVIAPSASVLAPLIWREPGMVGLLLGSRELLCLSSRISRTLVSCSSLSELNLLGESVNYQIQGESVGWWGIIIFIVASRRKTGLFSRVSGGSTRHVDVTSRHVNVTSYRGSTRHVVAAYRSAYRNRGSTRHVVAVYQGTTKVQ